MAGAAPAVITGTLRIGVVNGRRKPLTGARLLVTILDGFKQERLKKYFQKANISVTGLPLSGNARDLYTVIAWAKGYRQAGLHPVRPAPGAVRSVALMLVPSDAGYEFANARWPVLKQKGGPMFRLLAAGAASPAMAEERYTDLLENRPASLAGLLNIATAMQAIFLPTGTPLDYCEELTWSAAGLLPDRFFGFARRQIIDELEQAADQGVFAREGLPGVFHPGATRGFKQVQFGEANVQITLYETAAPPPQHPEWVKIECDMDYYRDAGSHALLEVFPNLFGSRTDPRTIYVLRWMAGKQAGTPEFDPPYYLT
ncbi:MAG: hypothetical protein HYS04_17560 [Acidobacteria bacterium]|nr:hypothetical protein [Acidobacteriota bacterium]